MASLGNHQGLGELGLAASLTERASWPSTSLHQPAAATQAASPPTPDPWQGGREGCQSPTEAWEMFSRSPNTAFLHSCQSPPSPSVFNLPSPPQSPPSHLPPQSPHAAQSPFSSPFPFPQSHPADHSSSNHVQTCPSVSRPQWDGFPPSPTSPTGRDNPFLPTTNPFIPSPSMVEAASGPNQCPVESPRVVVGPGGSGCSPGRPVWTADFFSGPKSKNVICS